MPPGLLAIEIEGGGWHRFAVIRDRGLTIKIDLAQEGLTQRIDSVSSQFLASVAAKEDIDPRNVW
jgi:hypothetical protein